MTTSELIKLLQEADPEGNTHIRMNGGVPVYVEHLPGYYDGAYAYIKKDGDEEKYVVTKEGSKIDIYCRDMEEFMEGLVDIHEPNNWEIVKSKYQFDARDEERYLQTLRKYYDDWYQMDYQSYQKNLTKSIERAKLGWKWYQNMEVDNVKKGQFNNHYYYTWIILNEDGGTEGSCVANNEAVLKSGQWEKRVSLEKMGYYEWIYLGE